MNTNGRKRFAQIALTSGAAFLAAALVAVAYGQQPPSNPSAAEAARAKRDQQVEAAREKIQGARDSAQGARDTARDDRQTTRDAREGKRDTVRDDRQEIRHARRDALAARREFIAERIRSGDFGLFLRRITNGLQVSDMANRGAIAQSGLKEGDEILSINGQPVTTERQFVDTLFADHESNKPAQVKIKRNGQEQTIAIQTKPFVDEHLASDTQLHDFGLVLDESDPLHVKVQTVIPRSPAFYGGMKSGDVITGLNGERISAVKDLVQTIANLAGNSTSVEVKRNGASRQLDVEVPDNGQQGETRTAAKPVLPSGNAPAPQQPQAAPGTIRPALPQQPRPNVPR